MKTLSTALRDLFVSLKLTVFLLVLSIILIFWATLSQADLGVWGVQQKFFYSVFVLAKIPGTELPVPIFPGGYFLGGLLLINLLAAHFYRFKYSWKKTGIWLAHFGIILLLVGEFASGLMQHDYDMTIANGQTRNYAESERANELAIIDVTHPKTDTVVSIPESLIARGDPIQNPLLPFRVVPKLYFPNADFRLHGQSADAAPSLATQGIGTQVDVVPLPRASAENQRDLPAAYIELDGEQGPIGTFLVSSAFPVSGAPFLMAPQTFAANGRQWRIVMRFKRKYLPFSLTLLKFSHDIYPGTNIPRNFSSRVRLTDPEGTLNREVLIYMNNPLRYGGLTFYQADYDHSKDSYTVLQVVRNPSWRIPYLACALIFLGLMIQFMQHLVGFTARRRTAAAAAAAA